MRICVIAGFLVSSMMLAGCTGQEAEKRIAQLEMEMQQAQVQIVDLQGQIKAMPEAATLHSLVDSVRKLVSDVKKLEVQAEDALSLLPSAQATMEANKVEALGGQVDTMQAEVATLQLQVEALKPTQGELDKLKAAVNQLRSRVDGLADVKDRMDRLSLPIEGPPVTRGNENIAGQEPAQPHTGIPVLSSPPHFEADLPMPAFTGTPEIVYLDGLQGLGVFNDWSFGLVATMGLGFPKQYALRGTMVNTSTEQRTVNIIVTLYDEYGLKVNVCENTGTLPAGWRATFLVPCEPRLAPKRVAWEVVAK